MSSVCLLVLKKCKKFFMFAWSEPKKDGFLRGQKDVCVLFALQNSKIRKKMLACKEIRFLFVQQERFVISSRQWLVTQFAAQFAFGVWMTRSFVLDWAFISTKSLDGRPDKVKNSVQDTFPFSECDLYPWLWLLQRKWWWDYIARRCEGGRGVMCLGWWWRWWIKDEVIR